MQCSAQASGQVARAGVLCMAEAAVPVPEGLRWLTGLPGGSAWLSELPRLVAGCARDWRLTLPAPIEPGSVSWVAQAELADGAPAVLKLSFPDEESEHEAEALELRAGRGAVGLYAYDRARHALLLERCEPGTPLWGVADEDAARLRRAPGCALRSQLGDACRWP